MTSHSTNSDVRAHARRVVHVAETIGYRVFDTVTGRLAADATAWDAEYHITPEDPRLSSFYHTVNTAKAQRRARIRGEHEPWVAEAIADRLDDTRGVWEIGSYRGYHTLSVAPSVDYCLAVDARHRALESLRRDAERNDYRNIETHQALLGTETPLDELFERYPAPDLVVMDIEGWEYRVLVDSTRFWEERPTLVVETHDESGWIDGTLTDPTGKQEDRPSPDAYGRDVVQRLLEANNYHVKHLGGRRETNQHLLAHPIDEDTDGGGRGGA